MKGGRGGLLATAAGLALFAGGIALVADAVRRGEASFGLVLIVPVVYGTSAELAGGIVLVVLGVLVASVGTVVRRAPTRPEGGDVADAEEARGGVGGLILIGPVPIFFGAGRRPSRRDYLWAVLAGGALFAVAVLVVAVGLTGR